MENFDRVTRELLFGRNKGEEEDEIPGAGTSAARVPRRHTRVKVTINLDGDLVNHFKQKAMEEGVGYQMLINRTLRECVEGSSVERMADEVKQLLLEDASFLAAIREGLEDLK